MKSFTHVDIGLLVQLAIVLLYIFLLQSANNYVFNQQNKIKEMFFKKRKREYDEKGLPKPLTAKEAELYYKIKILDILLKEAKILKQLE